MTYELVNKVLCSSSSGVCADRVEHNDPFSCARVRFPPERPGCSAGLEGRHSRAARPAWRSLVSLGFSLILMTGGKCVINVCTCMCEETENGRKIGKKKSKFQVALLFLFTPQAQSDLCLLESLNFNSLEESLVCPYLPLEGGCGCSHATGLWAISIPSASLPLFNL